MTDGRVWTSDDDAELRALHGEGVSARGIAAAMGWSPSTVSRRARGLGLSFDRAQVATATRARVEDSKAKRARLEGLLLDDALKLRAQLWEPTTIFNFGGKDNTYEEHHVDRPPFDGQKNIMGAVGIAVDRALKLAAHDTDDGVEHARSMAGALMAGLGMAWEQLQHTDDQGPDDAATPPPGPADA